MYCYYLRMPWLITFCPNILIVASSDIVSEIFVSYFWMTTHTFWKEHEYSTLSALHPARFPLFQQQHMTLQPQTRNYWPTKAVPFTHKQNKLSNARSLKFQRSADAKKQYNWKSQVHLLKIKRYLLTLKKKNTKKKIKKLQKKKNFVQQIYKYKKICTSYYINIKTHFFHNCNVVFWRKKKMKNQKRKTVLCTQEISIKTNYCPLLSYTMT